MEEILTPEDAKALYQEKNKEKIAEFNRLVKSSIDSGNYDLHLSFDQWGYNSEDIKFIRDAGWLISRNSACLCWEINILNIAK